jgi:hypothetical protein
LEACPAAAALPVSGINTPILTLSAAKAVLATNAIAATDSAAKSHDVLFILFSLD